jgi:nicotinamide-nucleotide amidase
LVFLGLARRGAAATTERHVFPGDRAAVRAASVVRALELLAAAAA